MYRLCIEFLFLFYKDPETVHRMVIRLLKIFGTPAFRWIGFGLTDVKDPALAQDLWGLRFKNPVGLAGGFDKRGEALPGLEALGFGFIEAGTVTWHAQSGNQRPRIFRFPQDFALINRMGFNNEGAEAFKTRIAGLKRLGVPLGISLSKSKITELKDAVDDYLASFKTLCRFGDYFVVNVSSPNTPGLRQLQDKDMLIGICETLNRHRALEEKRKPILIKIAPDLTDEAIDDILVVITQCDLDGIIAANTTVGREGLSVETFETGGMSGKPVRDRATALIRYIHGKAPTLPIIGVGGIFTAEDAYEKIRAGASLVQIYTGFIYGGPMTVAHINHGLVRLLKRDGFKNITEAIGSESKTV